MAYRYVLFDLDGTLTDPKPGITGSALHALEMLGIEKPNLDELERFIGPPLKDMFKDRYGFSAEKTQLVIRYYREYFTDRGIYENALYPGIEALLRDLKETGKLLALATTKPAVFAERIRVYFNIRIYFDAIAGGTLDDSVSKKEDIVRRALSELGRPDPRKAVLVGDTEYDLVGADRNGVDFIGVRYGYGFRDREPAAGQRKIRIVRDVEELRSMLLG